MEIQLGDCVREIVSGYEGHVTGLCQYLWGCEQALVARADKDGKPEAEWFDLSRLERQPQIAPLFAVAHGARSERATGPDKPAPIR